MYSVPTNIDSSDPTVNDDKSAGFIQGMFWYNSSSEELFTCKRDTIGAAVWDSITGGAAPEWQTWSPSLTWGGTAPTVNSTVARYTTDGNTVHFVLYINFTTGVANPTSLNSDLPVTPADIEVPIMPVNYLSKTGSVYAKTQYPYIDMDNPTGSSRKLYVPTFSLVAETTYGWCFSGFYEISS